MDKLPPPKQVAKGTNGSATGQCLHPSVELFEALFTAITLNDRGIIHFLENDLKNAELRFSLLTRAHPRNGLTIVQWAIISDVEVSALRILLMAGAETEPDSAMENSEKQSALWLAIGKAGRNGASNPKWKLIIKTLLEFKADPYFRHVISEEVDDEKEQCPNTIPPFHDAKYSLLHYALHCKLDGCLLDALCHSSGCRFLLEDCRNYRQETPLIYLSRSLGGNMEHVRQVIWLAEQAVHLEAKDCDGLGAYERAVLASNVTIALLIEALAAKSYLLDASSSLDYVAISAAHYRFHNHDNYSLELLFQESEVENPAEDGPFMDVWGFRVLKTLDEIDLPVDGLWVWIDENWKQPSVQENFELLTEQLNDGCLLPRNFSSCWYRRRKRLVPESQFPPFLQEVLKLISETELDLHLKFDLYPAKELILRYRGAVDILLENLRMMESNEEHRIMISAYLQRVMQRIVEISSGTEDQMPSMASNNCSSVSLPLPPPQITDPSLTTPVTRDFPETHGKVWKSRLSRLFSRNIPQEPTHDRPVDDLIYCPVCSCKLNDFDKSKHLSTCLQNQKTEIVGDRYTVLNTGRDRDQAMGEECPICFEELNAKVGGEKIAITNCLCRFHEKCIAAWFARGKQCPFHHE